MFLLGLFVSVMTALIPVGPAQECLVPPVWAPVAVAFRLPKCPYCTGQRGIEYAIGAVEPVRAAASGRVIFSGIVVGTRYVVVDQEGGLLATYGMLGDISVRVGAVVRPGQLIGHASSRLYFGIRRSGEYIDPVPLFARISLPHRLVPIDGSSPRPTRHRLATCRLVAETVGAPR